MSDMTVAAIITAIPGTLAVIGTILANRRTSIVAEKALDVAATAAAAQIANAAAAARLLASDAAGAAEKLAAEIGK